MVRQFCLIFLLLAWVGAAPAKAAGTMLDLGDGYSFELLGTSNTIARVANPKSISIDVVPGDQKISEDKERLLEGVDRLFESVLMGAAEKGYYGRATVKVRLPGQTSAEEFVFVRGANDVWLRQPGKAPWMTAQDPAAWTPPASQKMEVAGFGTFTVETALEIPAPSGFRRAVEVDFVTKTSMIDLPRKYQEIKALWARLDREKMRADGFDLVMLGNFAEPQRGRFHARRGFFIRIPREGDGPWPDLPASVPTDRDVLVSQNETQIDDLTKAIRLAFADRAESARLSFGAPPPEMQPDSRLSVGFALGTPAVRFDPKAFVTKIFP
ncbi:MAG: hypothetical protein KBA31_06640 [Alphaproteobacteria bacterium]|nr:hypothetical protein [Alphaproteobacteria bacterium]